jgi:putative Holliday junction resolvase
VVQHKRILALDYGERRIGIAMSDPTNCIAQGMPTITYTNSRIAIEEICTIVNNYQVKKIIVGMPYSTKGLKAHAAKQVDNFIKKLKIKLQIPILTWDERFTSVEAERALTEMGKSPSKHKDQIDKIAATLLLQSYLNSI